MAAAEEIHVDAALAAVLSELDDTFEFREERKNGTERFFHSVDVASGTGEKASTW